MKRVQSTCNYCALDCNMDFYVEGGRIVKVLPTKGYPVNDGFCCIKGLSLDKQQTVVKTSPLPKIRQADGTMKEDVYKRQGGGRALLKRAPAKIFPGRVSAVPSGVGAQN